MPEEVEEYFLGLLAFIDCTEQQIPRHVDKRRCEVHYSGKKKRHVIKNHFVVNNHDLITHKADRKKGCRYDYDTYKRNHPVDPKEVVNVIDLGY